VEAERRLCPGQAEWMHAIETPARDRAPRRLVAGTRQMDPGRDGRGSTFAQLMIQRGSPSTIRPATEPGQVTSPAPSDVEPAYPPT
jgi:hypothetical protein